MTPLKIVSISFHNAGKIFDFETRDLELSVGMQVIVETERGRALGTVVRDPREITPNEAPPKLKPVLRVANESDLNMAETNNQREAEALKFCQQRVQQRKMDMKLVRAEYLFDSSKIVFYFTSDGRVDFRDLVRDLAQHFRTRIEMRQIGVRDEAKLVGGLGTCGRELCCATHLRSFAPVSVKMAKAQGLALNPNKISGQCGRLLCCLAYEYETYNELRRNLPKCGKKVQLESGQAEVLSLDVLAQKMTVCCANGERCKVHVSELKKAGDKESPAKPQPSREKGAEAAPAPPAAPAQKTDEAQPDRSERRKRPSSRSRRPKSDQQKAASDENRSSAQEKPARKQPPKPDQKQAQRPDQEQTPGQNRKRRNRRRPRRPADKPQDSGNK
ncbi:MAG TPA: stage 0 sporulation family protein [Malonomonas sp.]